MWEGEDFSGMERVLAPRQQQPIAQQNRKPPVDFGQVGAVLAQNKQPQSVPVSKPKAQADFGSVGNILEKKRPDVPPISMGDISAILSPKRRRK